MSGMENEVEAENLVAAAIDAAEEFCDPLDELVEKTSTDPGPLRPRRWDASRR